VIGTGSGNVIDENSVTGNTQGIFIGPGARETILRSNIVIGNPAIQVGSTHRDVRTADIVNMAPAGQTTFERNVCVTGVNAPCPIVTRPQ
jgi:parallel beta-helix repeat protein